jgi:uncharacterized membrane protein YeaQ/YmgE (transglycosylase-associated protein family)
MDFTTYLLEHKQFVIMLINGVIAGWLAGLLLGGGGLIRNLIVGLIGSILGGMLVQLQLLNLPFDFDAWVPYGNQIAVSTIGAMLVILLARFIGR